MRFDSDHRLGMPEHSFYMFLGDRISQYISIWLNIASFYLDQSGTHDMDHSSTRMHHILGYATMVWRPKIAEDL
jgi:hypothetical protein